MNTMSPVNQPNPRGFTLVELLVVISIIVVLIAMMAPALSKAMEMSIRAVCASRIHTMIAGSMTYASNNKSRLPSGIRNGWNEQNDQQGKSYDNRTEHTVWVPSQMMQIAKEYGGHDIKGRGETNPLLTCPNFTMEFGYYLAGDPNNPITPTKRDNYVIGYSWLGGLPSVSAFNEVNKPYAPFNKGRPGNHWRSPGKLTDPANDIMADHNTWFVGAGGWMVVAHTPDGALGGTHTDPNNPNAPPNPDQNYFNWGRGGPAAHVDQAPSDGGNVGRSDGGVFWKRLDQMRVYESSWPWGGFPAMW